MLALSSVLRFIKLKRYAASMNAGRIVATVCIMLLIIVCVASCGIKSNLYME